MRGPGRGEGYNHVCPGNGTGLRRKRVGIGAGGYVHGQHLGGGAVDRLDCLGVKAGHRRMKTGSENRIDNQLGIAQTARKFVGEFLLVTNDDRTQGQAGEHFGGIATQFRRVGKQQHFDHLAGLVKLAGGDKAVSAVVAFSANNRDSRRLGKALARHTGDRRAGIFHQRQRMNAEALGGKPVDFPHLRRGCNFHERVPREPGHTQRRSR